MVTALFDTNVFGRIAEDTKEGARLVERITSDPAFVVINFRLIRNELRGAPRLLPLYDQLVAKRVIDETPAMRRLAEEYFEEYKINSGVQGRKKIMADFKIVACASLKGCDIVASDDAKTLKHPIAVQAYKVVNLRRHLRTPTFYSYNDLKRTYL